MKRVKKQLALAKVYTKEYKLEAIKLSQRIGASETRRRLGLPESTLNNWLRGYERGMMFMGEGGEKEKKPEVGSVAELQAELNRLRRENSHLKLDVEILKKATAYFAKGSK